MLKQILAIVGKDLAAELHTREILSAMAVFAVLSMLIFSFALDLRGNAGRIAAPGVLWATIAFAGTLGLSRSLAREQTNNAMAGLMLAVRDRQVIFWGKAIGNFVLMMIVEIVLLPLGTVLFDVNLLRGPVLLVFVLGTAGYAAVGTLMAAMAVNTRAREVLLPILLLPLVVPVLIAAVKTTGMLVDGLGLADAGAWVTVIVVYDLVMTAVALVTFEVILEA